MHPWNTISPTHLHAAAHASLSRSEAGGRHGVDIGLVALALLAAALAWLWPRLRWAWGSVAGLLLAAGMLARGAVRAWSLGLAEAVAWLLPAIVLFTGLEILNGEGIKLKSGVIFSADAPFGLQWRWMTIIGDWATPMDALAFRPCLLFQPERGIEPVLLLLRHDRCAIAHETGKVYLTAWVERDSAVVNARFGPLT